MSGKRGILAIRKCEVEGHRNITRVGTRVKASTATDSTYINP